MNCARYLVVLIAAFVLMIPAFSIPDDGHYLGGSDNQKTFDNQNSMMGPDGHGQQQIGPKSMMGNDGPKIVCLTICKVIGGGLESAPRSMMGVNGQDSKDKTCGCQSSVKGHGQDSQQKTCGCQSGQEQSAPRSMMGGNEQDGKDKTCGCQNSVMGESGQYGQHKSSNDSQKSWNGESGQDGQHNSWNHSQKSWNGDSRQDGQENTDDSQ